MRHILHGEIYVEDFKEIEYLFEHFNSCKRFCYVRMSRDGLKDPRSLAAKHYGSTLNSRWISDAACEAKAVVERLKENPETKVIFGGRVAWEAYKSGTLSKDAWAGLRSKNIYSRGDKTKKGNPNLRIEEKTLRITLSVGKTRKYKTYPFHISSRKRPSNATDTKNEYRSDQEKLGALLASGKHYNVRLSRKTDDPKHLRVTIDYEVEDAPAAYGFENGALGIDANPDRMALALIDPAGNLLETKVLINNRLQYGSSHKRLHDLGLLVKQIILVAKNHRVGIIFENLKFKKDLSAYPKKLRRILSNFVWKKFLEILERACKKNQIPYKPVNPAYTSYIGSLKYQEMHRITIHEAAAYVIGRRGLGFNESLSVFGIPRKPVKQLLLRTLEGKYQEKRIHSWRLWKALKDNETAVLTELRDCKLSGLKDFDGYLRGKSRDVGVTPTGKSSTITGRRGDAAKAALMGEERRPIKSMDFNGF